MSLTSVHPSFTPMESKWKTLRDFYEGEDAVKAAGTTYLPATPGMELDGMLPGNDGYKAYQAYKMRAVVPDYIREGVEILVGLLHQKDATIELPPELEPLRENASINGEPLLALHRRINTEQLTTGRIGLMVDLPANPDPLNPLPYIALYVAESIRNWDDSSGSEGRNPIDLVVLDESQWVRDGAFDWVWKKKYRVLKSGAGEDTSSYATGVFDEATGFNESGLQTPMLRGKKLEEIPFVFVNTKDLLPAPDEPPLMGLAQLCKVMYRGEADYRQALYMQSQDTLVVIGGVRNPTGVPGQPDAIRTGAGSRIDIDTGGDAKYIGTTSEGISEQRMALDNDRKRAEIKAGELVQSAGSQQESGAALNTRFTAQTATLNQIALSGAAGLEKALRTIASWMGADPKKVKVTPNLEFVNFGLDGQNFQQIMQARQMGFPISIRSLHAIAADRGLTVMDFLTEMKLIEEENKELAKILPNNAAPGAPAPANDPAKKPPQKDQKSKPTPNKP